MVSVEFVRMVSVEFVDNFKHLKNLAFRMCKLYTYTTVVILFIFALAKLLCGIYMYDLSTRESF